MPYQWKQHAEFDDGAVVNGGMILAKYLFIYTLVSQIEKNFLLGYFTLCIDNKPSSYQSKLVSLYVASFKRDEWEKYISELTEADLTTNNATSLLRSVDQNIHEMLKYMENAKQHYTYDSYLVESNRKYVKFSISYIHFNFFFFFSYVQNWSILQCIVIIISSVTQVYFVRKLFAFTNGKASRPRA